MKMHKWFFIILTPAILVLWQSSVFAGQDGYSLEFDTASYKMMTLTSGGLTIHYRAFENIVYVKHPVDIKYQMMNVYVPEDFYEGKSIGNYTINTAPIFFPNSVGGYMPSTPGSPGQGRNGGPNAAFIALTKGYVVAMPGARGRITQNAAGEYTGKAPACIVDLKAAVRYLRYNNKIMPGDAGKIISNGTSAGGALSSLLGATGNSKDYEPYLKEIGAADVTDDIFAASCYCPITNLDHADMAYEWLFNGINEYNGRSSGTMTKKQIELSAELKAMFPEYLNSLGLKASGPDLNVTGNLVKKGTILSLDTNGDGTFNDYVKSYVIASAQKALDAGTDLSEHTWITVKEGTVTDIDFERYIQYATRMKTTPAFDGVDLNTPENDLFGTAEIKAQHFTQFGMDHGTAKGSLADRQIVEMMNPMNYIGTHGTTTAKYWRIRHGTKDRDTSLAIPVMLATLLENNGISVDFGLPWDRGHGGDYDLDDLFSWISNISE